MIIVLVLIAYFIIAHLYFSKVCGIHAYGGPKEPSKIMGIFIWLYTVILSLILLSLIKIDSFFRVRRLKKLSKKKKDIYV